MLGVFTSRTLCEKTVDIYLLISHVHIEAASDSRKASFRHFTSEKCASREPASVSTMTVYDRNNPSPLCV